MRETGSVSNVLGSYVVSKQIAHITPGFGAGFTIDDEARGFFEYKKLQVLWFVTSPDETHIVATNDGFFVRCKSPQEARTLFKMKVRECL